MKPSTCACLKALLLTSAFAHTYVRGGSIRKANDTVLTVTNAPYNNSTGVITITTTTSHGLSTGNVVKLSGIKYGCTEGDKTYPEVGTGSVWSVTVQSGQPKEIICYHGGSGYNVGDVITIDSDDVGGGGDLTLTVGELEDNNATNLLLTNDKNNIRTLCKECRVCYSSGKLCQFWGNV